MASWTRGRFADTFFGRKSPDPYMTRWELTPKTPWGQLCLHKFHQPDQDDDPHDHARDFWTFPINATYSEETYDPETGTLAFETVPRCRWTFRRAEHCHRLTTSYNRITIRDRMELIGLTDVYRKAWPLYTLVWFRPRRREWGFWVGREHWLAGYLHDWKGKAGRQRAWLDWRAYIASDLSDAADYLP